MERRMSAAADVVKAISKTPAVDAALEFLNFYRNQHYADTIGTESRELAEAINTILPLFYKCLKSEDASTDMQCRCPFCGGEVLVVVCDDEGNIHEEAGYEDDPWSGLGYLLYHDITTAHRDCPIAGHECEGVMGRKIYDTREAAIAAWNIVRS